MGKLAIPRVVPIDHKAAVEPSGDALLSTAQCLLGFALFAGPLAFGAVNGWAWAGLTFLAIFSLLFWGASCVRNAFAESRGLEIQLLPVYLPALLFLLLALLQLSFGLTLDRIATREAVVKLATALIFLFLGSQLFASPPVLRRLGLGTAVFASLLGLFAVLQFFSSEGAIYWMVRPRAGWVFGPYVNHNHYAGLMEMLIPVGVAYTLSLRRDSLPRYMLGFGLLIALASVLLSGSRGGTLALLAEALILAVVLFWRRSQGSRVPAAVFGTASLIVILLFLWMDTGEISKRLATLVGVNTYAENYGDRGIVARDALRMFRANAWVGTGLGSFQTAFPRYRSMATDLTWDYAHNDYAQALAETGVPGGLLVAWAMVLFVRSAFKNLNARLDQPAGLIQFGAAVGICGLLVHSFVDFNLHISANAAWFAFCGGVSACRGVTTLGSDLL